jgi:nitrile hydratase
MTRFQNGDEVYIDDRQESRHHRVPAYAKGHCGEVVRVCNEQSHPEDLAAGDLDGPRVGVYRVRLRQVDLWPDYAGAADDCLDIEIYAHWLQRAP